MISGFNIRHAMADDLPVLRAIARDAYGQYVDVIGRKPAPVVDDFDARLKRDTIFVGEGSEGRNVVGYAVLMRKDDGVWLESIAVATAHIGQGIGTSLINHIEDHLSGCTTSYQLYTNVKMVRNMRWYERLGFIETGRGVENGFERVYYRKTLLS